MIVHALGAPKSSANGGIPIALMACFALMGCGKPDAPEAPEPAAPVATIAPDAPNAMAPLEAAPVAPAPTPVVEIPAKMVESIPAPASTPKAAAPEPVSIVKPAAFARCQSCHAVEAGAPHGTGPNLAGIMGARVGSRPGYAYSDAMAAFDGSWTPELMDAFLQNPKETVPGTKMGVGPVRDAGARAEIIDYLGKLR